MTLVDESPPPNLRLLLNPRDRRPAVTVFPSIGVADEAAGTWTIHLRAVAHRRVDLTLRWRLMLWSLIRAMRHPVSEGNAILFSERLEPFVGVPCRGLAAAVRIGPWEFPLEQASSTRGFLAGTVILGPEQVEAIRSGVAGEVPSAYGVTWLPLTLVDLDGGRPLGGGRVQVLPDAGLSVLSDIDDTIKLTGYSERRAMLANTFLRKFVPVEGMVELYQAMARRGIAFHYVSSSPWQLLGPLMAFQREFGYPDGSMHLRLFRLRDEMTRKIVLQPRKDKLAAGRALLRLFSRRRFVMVGDSADRDPEIYGRLAREFPDRIAAIWIRRHEPEGMPDRRRLRTLGDLPAGLVQVFDTPEDLDIGVDPGPPPGAGPSGPEPPPPETPPPDSAPAY